MRWAVPAAGGVVLLTQPWHGGTDLAGLALALGAAVCWAAYILLTQQVGDRVTGLSGLAVSMPVAGTIAMLAAAPSLGRVTWQLAAMMLGLAVLHPVVPFSLEFLALRRLTASSFGTLMSLEPAIALLAGLLVLEAGPRPRLRRRRHPGGHRRHCRHPLRRPRARLRGPPPQESAFNGTGSVVAQSWDITWRRS